MILGRLLLMGDAFFNLWVGDSTFKVAEFGVLVFIFYLNLALNIDF